MSKTFTSRLVLAVALAAAAVGAQASVLGARDPYSDGARAVQSARDVFSEGARSVQDQRSPFTDGARTLAGMDRTGVSAAPARSVDPYLDGAYA
ncbi:hydroxyquinol 1,2-dioxygenase [Cupriavidus sp.]|uniref:hydroxyquinol 1,2-dioxygenase n=1 Tax=Cupriavidus sp. TaxID=1873897 RepID=UPI0028BD4007|nr:hydroxyquinol 1,2-dioxygenase [Cupriavidus sp.]